MSDSLPENSFSGVLKVLKLVSGEELIGMVKEETPNSIEIKMPALMQNFMQKDSDGNLIEYVKLVNYLSNIKGYEITISKNIIIYLGQPKMDLEKMYEIYFMAMQQDPKSMVSSGSETLEENFDSGLELLNNLFTNEDFVNFVNDLIDTYEGIEPFTDEEEDEVDFEVEGSINDSLPQEPASQPKPKKRNRMKPEKKSLPYKPDGDPNKPETWPDDPSEYI